MPFHDNVSGKGSRPGKPTVTGSTRSASGPASKVANASKSAPPSSLQSNVSGTKLPGTSPKGGMGGKSPTADKHAAQAAKAGMIKTSGQARGGPRQMSSAVSTPKGKK